MAPVRTWPEDVRRHYRELGLWTDETFADFVADRTERFADRSAVVGRDARGDEHRWTYTTLRDRADAVAAHLAEVGVEPGDRVVVALPNIVEFASTILGLFRLGALPVFALPTHRETELAHFCNVADAAALVVCGLDVDLGDRLTVEPPVVVDVRDWDLLGSSLACQMDAAGVRSSHASSELAGPVRQVPPAPGWLDLTHRPPEPVGPDAPTTSRPSQPSANATPPDRTAHRRPDTSPPRRDAASHQLDTPARSSQSYSIGGLARRSSAGERSETVYRDQGPTSEDIAFLQLSGGTTGLSKLIPRTAADYLYSVRESARICELDGDSTLLVVLPVSHNFAMSSPGILGVWHVGGTVVLALDPSPRTAFGLIEREQVDVVSLVPPLAQAWISAARRRSPDLSSLRLVQVGGARLSDAVAEQIQPVLHGRLQQVFGMAEGLVNYTRADDPDELVLTTQGRPISPHDEIRVIDGRLMTRGPYTIRGYYRAEAADRDSFTDDGFYCTGDLVERLPSGHLIVTGREKDQINRAGEKIAPDEIETPLLTHPDVLDAVAVGVPDSLLGERLCVVVRAEDGRPEPTDLAEHLRAAGLATHKLPDEFRFLDSLPETHVGKNSRRDLRRLLAQQLTP